MTVADETDQPSFDDCSFAVEGLKLSGAVCRGNMLAISSEISTPLHLTRLRWIRNTEGGQGNSCSKGFLVLVYNLVYSLYILVC